MRSHESGVEDGLCYQPDSCKVVREFEYIRTMQQQQCSAAYALITRGFGLSGGGTGR